MDIKETILTVMKEAGKPISAGEVEKLSGLDRKDIDKAFKEQKKEEAIVSPARCKWVIYFPFCFFTYNTIINCYIFLFR